MEPRVSNLERLEETRRLAQLLKSCLVPKVEAASLTHKSKVPFKALSFRELLHHRVSTLATAAVSLFDTEQHLAAVVVTRSIVETVAVTHGLHKRLQAAARTGEVSALDAFLMRSLMASREPDWKYQATDVLGFVDSLDKRMPGFRASYHGLSEYAHPNWAGVLGAFGEVNHEDLSLILGPSKVASMFGSGINSLCGALVLFQTLYNEMVPLLHEVNERCEGARAGT